MAKKSILNDVGTFDLYPVLATCASVGYGASGYRGFQTVLSLTDTLRMGTVRSLRRRKITLKNTGNHLFKMV